MSTKAPWKFIQSESKIVSETEFMYDDIPVTVVSTYGAMGGRDTVADAVLLASAPELLEELKAIVDQARAQFRAGDRYATFSRRQIDLIQKTINKAEMK